MSVGFKVKTFIVRDANLYPIVVEFEKQSKDGVAKTLSRTLFGRNNPYPQKKVLTFNKHTDDFDFNVNYGDTSFTSEEISKNITKVSLKGKECVRSRRI